MSGREAHCAGTEVADIGFDAACVVSPGGGVRCGRDILKEKLDVQMPLRFPAKRRGSVRMCPSPIS